MIYPHQSTFAKFAVVEGMTVRSLLTLSYIRNVILKATCIAPLPFFLTGLAQTSKIAKKP